MQKLLQLARWIDRLTEGIGWATSWLVVLMVGIGVWNAVGRYVGQLLQQNLSSNAFIESQWYLFDLVFLLGAACTLKRDDHVRVDVFYGRWPARRQALINLVGSLVFLLPFCAMVIYFSWGAVLNSWRIGEVSPDPGGLPRYPIKAMILVGFALLMIQGLSEVIKSWAILRGHLAPQGENPDGEF